MDMLNRIKSTVQSTVGQLIGNPLSREFDIQSQHGSAGGGYLWKVYDGVKKSTKQEVAVFVLEKKLLEKYSREDKENILNICRRGVTQLTRLRHPRLLTVQHPLEESRECLAFATEPVFASLGNILGCHDNLPTPIPADLKDYQLYEVEIKYGLQQISEALAFLHNDVHMIHGNVNPATIVVNQNGAWKLSGLDFCITSATPKDQQPLYSCKEWDPSLPSVAQPALNYLAPEYIMTVSCDTASDMYSMAMVIYAVFNKGKSLFDCDGNLKSYQRNCQQLNSLHMSMLKCLPETLRDYVKMLFSPTPTVRPDANQLTKITFFDDVGAKTLEYLDSLFQWDNLQKSQFFKGLPKVISKLPKRVVQQRVLPCLFKEFYNADMIPFVLPNVLIIAEDYTDKKYCQLILPHLKPVFKLQEPIQILLIFLQKMDLLLSKTPADDVKHHVLPMVYRALETSSPHIQELCLSIIPTFAGMIEYAAMKHSIVPRIKTLCLQTDLLSVRVHCLVCVGRLLEYMDKWFVLDEIFPLLAQIPSKEPPVLMAMLGIYKTTLEHKKLGIPKDILAAKVLPVVFPLCIDNNLNLNQFNAFMTVMKDMMKQVETEQRNKLQQLLTMQKEQKGALDFAANGDKSEKQQDFLDQLNNKGQNQNSSDSVMDKMFKSFGLGSFIQSKPEKLNAASHGACTPIDNTDPSKSTKVSLSLEEKQKLLKDQELQRRLKSQKPLTPNEVPKTMKPLATDLTHTLMSTNTRQDRSQGKTGLNSQPAASLMYTTGTTSSIQTPAHTSNMQNTGQGMSTGSAYSTLGIGSSGGMATGIGMGMGGMPAHNTVSTSQYTTPGFGMSTSTTHGFGMGTSSSMGYGVGMGMGQQSALYGRPTTPSVAPSQSQQSNIDLSAFDDLLGPSHASKQKMSMNQMAVQNQQQRQHIQPGGGTEQVKQNTASSDLTDLLG
ncbi:SCY1-like protein 2 [Glandiceps talaboti]